MQVVICGTPNVGKKKLADGIARAVHYRLSRIRQNDLNPVLANAPAVGPLADYRMEHHLAIDRSFYHLNWQNTIMTHSLVDSLAYAGLKLSIIGEGETELTPEADRASGVFWIAQQFLSDSFNPDLVFFIPGNDGTGFNIDLEEALQFILEDVSANYVILTGDYEQDLELCVRLIEEKLNEDTDPKRDSTQPAAEQD